MSLCVPLTGSAMCSDFAGLSALVPAQAVSAGVTTAAALDAYIASSSDPTPSGGFGGAMRSSVFGCTGWDGTGFRYYASVLCATMIAQGIANVDTPTPCNPAGTVVPLCDATIGKYIFAYQRVYQNTLFCPAGANPTAQALVNNVIGMRAAAVFSTDATCVVAEGVEKSNCGFNTAAEATNFAQPIPRMMRVVRVSLLSEEQPRRQPHLRPNLSPHLHQHNHPPQPVEEFPLQL
ncbi:hypothetical protein BDR26DRAFT_116697 [Obelidium mucronatum]|nr:hypothetical protein BDR26DRAFT_116697 [Obelidium mucronatum]